MQIRKKNPAFKTIEEVVLNNVGTTREDFLYPKSNYHVNNIDNVIELIDSALYNNRMIVIYGDYDVDGISASAIMKDAIVMRAKMLNVNYNEKKITVYIPGRETDGYGLNTNRLKSFMPDSLLITVDNGIVAIDAVKKAKEMGMTVIVTDHHLPLPDGTLPEADVLIDAHLEGTADFAEYCGAGIAYKIAQKMLGENHPNMKKLLGIAAIATVADVMPLVGENRFIVKEGLKTLVNNSERTLGVGALMSECKFGTYISAKNVAFKIAPMLNAPGRLEDFGSSMSYALLSEDKSYAEAMNMAEMVSDKNETRKRVKEDGIEVLEKQMKENGMYSEAPLVFYHPGLIPGIVGILAGHFAEEYCTPCFVFTDSEDENLIKGSARSYGDINIKELLDKNADLIYAYGGHAGAAGLTLEKSRFEDFKDAMLCELAGSKDETKIEEPIYYDLAIDAKDIGKVLETLETYAPFGEGNPEIVFYIKNFSVISAKYLQEGRSVKLDGSNAKAICFDMGNDYNKIGEPKVVDLIGTLGKNSFMNTVSSQVEVQKIIPVKVQKEPTNMAEMLRKMAEGRR